MNTEDIQINKNPNSFFFFQSLNLMMMGHVYLIFFLFIFDAACGMLKDKKEETTGES